VDHQPNPAIIGDEVGQGVAGEETWTKGGSIRGFVQREAHRRSHSTAACIDREVAGEVVGEELLGDTELGAESGNNWRRLPQVGCSRRKMTVGCSRRKMTHVLGAGGAW
jgi:hypothetical protein